MSFDLKKLQILFLTLKHVFTNTTHLRCVKLILCMSKYFTVFDL